MKIVLAFCVSIVLFFILNGIGQFGHLDTTGKFTSGETAVFAVISFAVFLWSATRTSK